MPLVYADRVKETTVTLGTGAVTLTGAVAGFRTFLSAIGNGNQTYYVIVDDTTGEWEVGLGLVAGTTLQRSSVLTSSNADALVDFGPNAKSVFATSPATFFTAALDAAAHATINHVGLPGVPAPEAFTSGVHAATSHAGIPGVGDLSLVAHNALSHAGIPGVGDLSTAAHAALDHTGIPGVGDLTIAAHAALDHSALPGVRPLQQATFAQNLLTSTFTFYTLPAGALGADGDSLLVEVWLDGLGSGSTTITIALGGVTLVAKSMTASSGRRDIMRFNLVRTGAATSIGTVQHIFDVTTTFDHIQDETRHISPAITWASAQALTAAASNNNRARLVFSRVTASKAV